MASAGGSPLTLPFPVIYLCMHDEPVHNLMVSGRGGAVLRRQLLLLVLSPHTHTHTHTHTRKTHWEINMHCQVSSTLIIASEACFAGSNDIEVVQIVWAEC